MVSAIAFVLFAKYSNLRATQSNIWVDFFAALVLSFVAFVLFWVALVFAFCALVFGLVEEDGLTGPPPKTPPPDPLA